MVGPLDPGDYRDAELLPVGPGAAVEDVLLQQREERFHGGVVPARPDSSHAPDHAVPGESTPELPASKLRSSVRMHDAAGGVAAHRDRVLERLNCQAGLHPRVDRVPHDPTAAGVFDRAAVELSLGGLVLRDVHQPELVRFLSSEHVSCSAFLVDERAEVIVNRRTGPAVLASLGFPERAEPAVGRRDLPRGPIRHALASVAGLVGEQPVPELGVVLVGVEQRVRAVRLHHLTRGDGVRQPPVVGLAGELEHPTRHRYRDPCGGELAHERVEPFPGRFACDR